MFLKVFLCVFSLVIVLVHGINDESLGDVVLVLSRGRSGSGYLMRVLNNVADTNHDHAIAGELFLQKFGEMETMKNPTKFLRSYLSERRKEIGKGKFIGSKWKPYVDNKRFDKCWQYVAKMHWPVIYSHRNPLDVVISTAKHAANDLPPHCKTGQTECVETYQNTKVDIDIPAALSEVKRELNETDYLRQKITGFGVRFIELTYEQLVYGSDADRLKNLQRVADFFLPPSRRRRVRMKDFETGIEMTGSYNQSQFVKNYDALTKAFQGQYKFLLHP